MTEVMDCLGTGDFCSVTGNVVYRLYYSYTLNLNHIKKTPFGQVTHCSDHLRSHTIFSQSMWTPDHHAPCAFSTSYSNVPPPLLAAISWRHPTRFWNVAAMISTLSATRAVVRRGSNVKPKRPGIQSVFQFIPKVLIGVEDRAQWRALKFIHTELYGA